MSIATLPPPTVLRQRDFGILWLSTLLSVTALSIAWVCESWYTIKVLQRESEFGYVLIAGMLPRLACMLLSGALADRWPKLAIIGSSLLLRAALLLLLGALMWLQRIDFATLLLFALLYGVLDACYWPARDALLPALLPAAQLPQGNAVMLITGQAGMVAGPALAGLLLSWLPYGTVLMLQGALLLLAVLLLPALTISSRSTAAPSNSSLRAELAEGWHYVRQHRLFATLMTTFTVANLLFMGPLQQSMPLLVMHDLGATAGAYSTLLTCFGCGMAVGGLLMARWSPRRARFRFIMLMLLLEGLLLAMLAWTPSLAVAAANTLLLGCCVACNNVPTLSLLQSHADPAKMGRVMGLNDAIGMGLTPLSYAVVALLLSQGIGHQPILLTAGLALSAFCLVMGVRHRQLLDT